MFNIQSLNSVPHKPGVYLWKDLKGNVLYIGKAKDLQKRMKQYFLHTFNNKKLKMVSEINNFDYIVTNTEKEALTLEYNLIKENTPPYNVLLMDDKRYPYIRLELKKTLSIKIVRKVIKDNAFYYGPFPNGAGSLNVFNLLVHLVMYKDGLPYNDENDYEYWKKSYDLCREILKPNNDKFKKILNKNMLDAAEKMQFEIANEFKKALNSLDFYISNNAVEFIEQENIDVVGVVEKDSYIAIMIMVYRYGKLLSKIDNIFELNLPIEELVQDFIEKYYQNNLEPEKIILNSKFTFDSDVLPLAFAQKGKFKKALDIVESNADELLKNKLDKFVRKVERTSGSIQKLANILNISKPFHILVIDNSNLQNQEPISAIISYKNGVKQKNEYRKFNLDLLSNRKADVEYMQQALNRYFAKNPYPDLLLVDGGVAQLNAAKEIVGNNCPIAGLVKNDFHKFRGLVIENGHEIKVEDELLKNFLTEIQEEVDRFAKTHFRKKYLTNSLESKLLEVKGLGLSTIKKLLNKFETYSGIYSAKIEDLEKIVSKKIALEIKQKFN